MYVYKVSNAGVLLAFVIAVSISACLVLTASLWVDIALGIAVDFSVFLVIYQSVLASSLATDIFNFLINFVFKPSITCIGSNSSPFWSTAFLSACALGVAVPQDLVTLLSAKAKVSFVLMYQSSSLKLV